MLLLLILLVAGCGASAPTTPATPATPPTSAGTAASTSTLARGSANTVYAEEQPTVPPPTSIPAPTSTPAPPPAIIDVSRQQAAMLPEFAADLQAAPQWDTYIITATLLPKTQTVVGEMQLALYNRDSVPFETLAFHLYPNHPDFGGSLAVDNVRVQGQPVASETAQEGVLLLLELAQPLAPGERALVSMQFTAQTSRNASGRSYGAFNQENGVWTLANFYPLLARRFAGGWDTRPVDSKGDFVVAETALYEVAIDTPPELTLVATGTRAEQMQLDHGPRREHFVSGPQREFFLTALEGLSQSSTVVDGTRITSYYQPGNPAAGQRSVEIAAQSLRIFNERFGRYPLAELDVIQAALTTFLGVEYPGVLLMEQSLYRPNSRTFETTLAHEVAHQWWYSLVGNDVQGEAWLDEGLTSYAQVVYYEGLGRPGDANVELELFRNMYLSTRRSGGDAPLNQHNSAFSGNYVPLVYGKGALFFQALRNRLGDETFSNFIQNYYATYRYDEATGQDMLDVAQETCNCDLQPLYNDWIIEAAPVAVP
jgi:hypothetical protein